MEAQLNKEHQVYFADPEVELDAVDRVIYPRLLEMLNQAKIDYNWAANPATDKAYREYLVKAYINILKDEHLLDESVRLRDETYAKRPMLATVMEQAIALTIDWLRLITRSFTVKGTAENFSTWAETRIESERQFLRNLIAGIRDIEMSQLSKRTATENSGNA